MSEARWTITHEAQLAGSDGEPLAMALAADLASRGLLRSQTHNWDDRITVATSADGRIVGVICWRLNKWNRAAFISLGGTAPTFRRQGAYRALFEALVSEIRANHAEVEHIDSGHHIDNAASAAMHKALGRKLDSLGYSFPISRTDLEGRP
ncbi:GNAT family N-acetyltransferase [Brevundimonas intermedia]|nr:GNAT family N-acetyltransferase [Brevundimonas intermedia]